MPKSATQEKPFWQGKKFWMEMVTVVAFVALAVTKTATFTNTEILVFLLGVLGIGVGGHTLTDSVSLIARALLGRNGGQVAVEDLAGRLEGGLDDDGLPRLNVDAKMPATKPPRDDRITPIETPTPRESKEVVQ